MYAQHGHYQSEAERLADQKRREVDQLLKELGEQLACIVNVLGIQIRGGATNATDAQLDTASQEFGKRFAAIREYTSVRRLEAPTAKNRY